MYNDDPTLAGAQKVMLEILLEVHRVCEKHQITYWLDYGTLLGAVRHKGFIPWDDDVDISMPRDEYDRFCKIAPQEITGKFFFQTQETDKGYPRNFAKVRMNGTMLVEHHETDKENYHQGIYIDIFPFDYSNSSSFMKAMEFTSSVREQRRKYPRGTIKRHLYNIYSQWLLAIPHELCKYFRIWLSSYPNLYGNKNSKYLSQKLDSIFTIEIIEKKSFLPVKFSEECFEGHGFYIPNDYDTVLTTYFGDYMTPPPEDCRRAHAKAIILDVNATKEKKE